MIREIVGTTIAMIIATMDSIVGIMAAAVAFSMVVVVSVIVLVAYIVAVMVCSMVWVSVLVIVYVVVFSGMGVQSILKESWSPGRAVAMLGCIEHMYPVGLPRISALKSTPDVARMPHKSGPVPLLVPRTSSLQ